MEQNDQSACKCDYDYYYNCREAAHENATKTPDNFLITVGDDWLNTPNSNWTKTIW
jgi:hypothetical protein